MLLPKITQIEDTTLEPATAGEVCCAAKFQGPKPLNISDLSRISIQIKGVQQQ